jgi:curved DNA-binding protein
MWSGSIHGEGGAAGLLLVARHVEMPADSSSGWRLRLRAGIVPNPRGAAGDLYAEVKIVMPATLLPRERELFKRLARESSFSPRSAAGSRPAAGTGGRR